MISVDWNSSDEEGLSDDNDYQDFKERLKWQRLQGNPSNGNERKRLLDTVFYAITYGQVNIVLAELDKGLDINVDLESGWTPLLLAASLADDTLILELVRRGVDLNQTKDGSTALMLACNCTPKDETTEDKVLVIAKLLVELKVDVNTVDRKRRTAMMFACRNGHLEVVKFLAPLCDKEAEDNQKWTALFYAVDGNREDVTQFLMDSGFNTEKIDIRGNSIWDLAQYNGFSKILNILPSRSYTEIFLKTNADITDFKKIFKKMKKDERPKLFNQVCKILYGCQSETTVPIFEEQKIDLCDFASITDAQLKEIGIELPYQRGRILGGIYNLHKHPYHPKSIPFVPKEGLFTNIDVAATLLSCIRQIILMEASVKFIMKNYTGDVHALESLRPQVSKLKCQISRLKLVTERLLANTKEWDEMLKPADKITQKSVNRGWAKWLVTFGIFSCSLIISYKYF